MKVVQINQTCGAGSTGKIAVGISNVLEENGHEGYIAYAYYNTDRKRTFRLRRWSSSNAFRVELMKCRLTGYFGFNNKRITYKLIDYIRDIKPDIIHLHNIHGGYIHIEVLFEYLAKAKIPIVWTLHDCWSFTGHCTHFDYIQCEKWKTGCFDCPEKESYPKRYFFDRSKEQYMRKKKAFTSVKNMTLVTPSEWLGNLVMHSYLGTYPVFVINNGIDLSIFKPTENNIKEKYNIKDKRIVLAVANSWTNRKGYNYLEDLAERLGDNYKLIVIGLNKRQKVSLSRKIIGIEKTENQIELAKYYTVADVFVNMTFEDNFPTVNLEAIACGTPVVTYNTGGSPECIDESTGYFVDKGNISELVEKVKLAADENKTQRCIERAAGFSEKIKFNQYLELYNKILEENTK